MKWILLIPWVLLAALGFYQLGMSVGFAVIPDRGDRWTFTEVRE